MAAVMRHRLRKREVPKFIRSAGSADSTYMVKSRAVGVWVKPINLLYCILHIISVNTGIWSHSYQLIGSKKSVH